MPKLPIKLGRSVNSIGGGVPAPEGPASETTVYPSLYLEWEKPYDMPDSGTMVIRFNKKSETKRKPKGDQKGQYQVDLDVTEITKITPDEKSKEDDEDSGEALDKIAKEVETMEDPAGYETE